MSRPSTAGVGGGGSGACMHATACVSHVVHSPMSCPVFVEQRALPCLMDDWRSCKKLQCCSGDLSGAGGCSAAVMQRLDGMVWQDLARLSCGQGSDCSSSILHQHAARSTCSRRKQGCLDRDVAPCAVTTAQRSDYIVCIASALWPACQMSGAKCMHAQASIKVCMCMRMFMGH